MKRLFVILLVLCPYFTYGSLSAQLYRTSSGTYHSYTTSGGLRDIPTVEFRSTSTYGFRSAPSQVSQTAPMMVANGSVRTVASSVTGGVLAGNSSQGNNYSSTVIPVIPGVPDTPIGGGWDVVVFLGLLSLVYAMCVRRKVKA